MYGLGNSWEDMLWRASQDNLRELLDDLKRPSTESEDPENPKKKQHQRTFFDRLFGRGDDR